MFSLSPATEVQVAQLAPLFQLQVRCWFAMCNLMLGYDMVVVSGRRTAAQQAALHAQDKRNPAPVPGKPDVHQLGIAVDVNAYKNGQLVLTKKGSTAEQWQPVANLAGLFGLRWGHNFSNYDDLNHFDAR